MLRTDEGGLDDCGGLIKGLRVVVRFSAEVNNDIQLFIDGNSGDSILNFIRVPYDQGVWELLLTG